MSGAIFLIQNDGQLMEMNEQGYDSEDILQTLLAKYPNLMSGDHINNEAPRRREPHAKINPTGRGSVPS
jgi:hypothetical protein